uniref:Variable large protein n=1 Tax=Romanomermis culicivorax TaxID=13658 RepID=A0A915HYI4_ROMCU
MIKCKTNDNGDTDVSATKIAGKDDAGTRIIGEEGYDARKIVKEEVADATKIVKEEGVEATKFTGESGYASEDQKAVSIQTIVVNELFMDYFNDPNHNSLSDTSLLDNKTKPINSSLFKIKIILKIVQHELLGLLTMEIEDIILD